MDEKRIINTPNIRLTKSMLKNNYSWEIRISDDDLNKAVEEVEKINNLMLSKFKKEGVKKE